MRGSSGDISPVLARINLRRESVAGQEADRHNRDNFVRSRFRSRQRRNDIRTKSRFTRFFFQIAYNVRAVRRNGSTGTIKWRRRPLSSAAHSMQAIDSSLTAGID
jgi:hypothetical protein